MTKTNTTATTAKLPAVVKLMARESGATRTQAMKAMEWSYSPSAYHLRKLVERHGMKLTVAANDKGLAVYRAVPKSKKPAAKKAA